jgi:hypothetical protein
MSFLFQYLMKILKSFKSNFLDFQIYGLKKVFEIKK